MAFSPFLEDILQVTGKGRNLRKRGKIDQKERKIQKSFKILKFQLTKLQNTKDLLLRI